MSWLSRHSVDYFTWLLCIVLAVPALTWCSLVSTVEPLVSQRKSPVRIILGMFRMVWPVSSLRLFVLNTFIDWTDFFISDVWCMTSIIRPCALPWNWRCVTQLKMFPKLDYGWWELQWRDCMSSLARFSMKGFLFFSDSWQPLALLLGSLRSQRQVRKYLWRGTSQHKFRYLWNVNWNWIQQHRRGNFLTRTTF